MSTNDHTKPAPRVSGAEASTAPGAASTPTDPAGTVAQSPSSTGHAPGTAPAPDGAPAFGYEILGELGRGGMGIVYKARQTNLKRIVALKVMRGGADAAPEQLERFRVEAEAVARVQHPNIVQIYEVGEYKGWPFCALEYVDGGNLSARLKEEEFAPKDAAALVELLARAVQHAHEKGIIHRDLKPGNVLLTPDGTPKITDFGLAKRLEDDSGQTRTGMVMGTPSYMAPEQAAGRIHDIGPPTDIWALGAILYELLTGRPPFTGESAVAVVHAVLNSEVVSLSRVAHQIPRDLETICLKCLEKGPQRRYSSALALAHDLERFRAGEPILARRQGVFGRAWRKLRKRALVVGLLVALVAAVGTTAWVVSRSQSERKVAALGREFETELEAAELTSERRTHLEGVIERLAAADPARASEARKKLTDRAVKQFRDALVSRVDPPTVPGLEADLAWIAERDAELGDKLRGELRGRLASWQTVVDLTAPFDRRDAVFAPGRVAVAPSGLSRTGEGTVPTRIASRGPLRAEVVFAPGWEDAAALGVVIHLPQATGGKPLPLPGYTFRIVPAPPQSEDAAKPAPAPKTLRGSSGAARAELLRDGVPLSHQVIRTASGPLKLTAERVGDRLQFRVNDAHAIDFADTFPLLGTETTVIGVVWQAPAVVARFRVESQVLPKVASPLERGDDLYDRGQFADAVGAYMEQVRASTNPEVLAEARCKAAMSLARANRHDEAIALFGQVIAQSGDRWPVLAACQLWLLYLEEKKFDDADTVSKLVSGRFTREQLARHVSLDLRERILAGYPLTPIDYLQPDAEGARRRAAAVKLSLILEDEATSAGRLYGLMISYALAGQLDEAIETGREYLPSAMAQSATTVHAAAIFPWAARWYCWLLRKSGRTDEARSTIAKWEAEYPWRVPGQPAWFKQAYLPIYLEKARLLAEEGEWAKAEEALDYYLKEYPRPITNYSFFSQPYLMKGFCRHEQGDPAGAQKAWAAGLYREFKAQYPNDPEAALNLPAGRYGLLEHWMMASLTGQLPDDEGKELWARLVGVIAAHPGAAQMASTLAPSPATMRTTWSSDRGRELARKQAFYQSPPSEHFRVAPTLVGYEKLRQDLFAGAPTAAQDEVLWDAMSRAANGFFTRKISVTQGLYLAFAWSGTSGPLGWGGVANALAPETRGPIAYVMGVRYLQRKDKSADAKTMFQTAVKDAPADSALKKLAQVELDRLNMKK
jgi:tetratricopeptide (TPR) repeat protein/predicted Ser/Thr protein kinase